MPVSFSRSRAIIDENAGSEGVCSLWRPVCPLCACPSCKSLITLRKSRWRGVCALSYASCACSSYKSLISNYSDVCAVSPHTPYAANRPALGGPWPSDHHLVAFRPTTRARGSAKPCTSSPGLDRPHPATLDDRPWRHGGGGLPRGAIFNPHHIDIRCILKTP